MSVPQIVTNNSTNIIYKVLYILNSYKGLKK